ncbi:MAG TPA: PEP-utilizing enzyme [Anaerolineales bacterium]|nr:PEP-utilizing enzyme [Anaerolineales bacterium]
MSTSSTQAPTPGQPIPTPPDFSVVWDDPRDAKLTWMSSPQFKTPISPLIYAVIRAFLVGGNAGMEGAGLPFEIRVERINTYPYMGMVPKAAPPEMAMKAMGLLNRAAPGVFKMMMGKVGAGMSKQQEAALNPIIEKFESYWYDELLPEIKQHIAYFESSDLRGMSLDQLRAHLGETLKRVERMGALHGVVMPMLYAMSQFEELYCELFEGASTLDALRLTQGFDNKTMEGDRALWRLSRLARSTPEVQAILSSHSTGDVIPALEKSAASQPFLADLRAWLAQYGQRLNSVFSLSEPSWIEDPTPAIQNLQAYVAMPDLRPEMEPAALAAEREKSVAEARAKLAGYPQPIAARFETLLKAAQVATIVHEDHNFWIDQRCFYHVRRVIMEFGGRLAQAGVLDAVNDVFYLTTDEMQNGRDVPMKRLVQERKVEMELFSRVTPPPMLGTAPAFEMTDGGSMIRALFKGEMSPANTRNGEANKVKGLAGSAGVARGTARVIRSLAEAGKLQPGDVLVAISTEPPWTPLFATASAIVTDSGGVLSHSAVVAREYRIPAVVGAGNATTTFKDGQLIEVDGNAGTVRVVSENQQSESLNLQSAVENRKSNEPALAG